MTPDSQSQKQYLERLKLAVEHLHNCGAVHTATEAVHEVFKGQTVWQGDVEVFDLTGHPKAKRAYAWSHADGKDDQGERFVTVLELPPVVSAKTAVQVVIAGEIKQARAKKS
jgi:hypothetical protein